MPLIATIWHRCELLLGDSKERAVLSKVRGIDRASFVNNNIERSRLYKADLANSARGNDVEYNKSWWYSFTLYPQTVPKGNLVRAVAELGAQRSQYNGSWHGRRRPG